MPRDSDQVVSPRAYRGYGTSITLNLFGVGPKFTISCGGCPGTFTTRIPLVDSPTVRCPHCLSWNELDLVIGDD